MKRQRFLKEFLGALGAEEIHLSKETINSISGTVIYVPEDPNEKQDFCWHITEENVPTGEVLRLVELIRSDQLLSIDQLNISCDQLRRKYNKKFNTNFEKENFSQLLETLETVEVQMVDEGKETDSFCMHK